jgi:hypothetical protein
MYNLSGDVMRDFIDLQGASGASYRFRAWPERGAHLPIAGNYVFVREVTGGYEIVRLGATTDLSRCRTELGETEDGGATHLFTRLNIGRSIRESQHEDIAAKYQPALVGEEET